MWQLTKNRFNKWIIYCGFVFIMLIKCNNCSALPQNLPSQQHPADYVRNNVGINSGEVMADRLPTLNAQEPSCEELRAMWRFSKRQSRASEISNELPTYRDPFGTNVWDPYYPTTRNLGGIRKNSQYRELSRPVYGRVIHKEPSLQHRPASIGRTRSYKDISRYYNNGDNNIRAWGNIQNDMELPQTQPPRRRVMQFRFGGATSAANTGGNKNPMGSPVGQNLLLIPQKGSFQRLKELIWTERARQLAQQRKAEEMIARAAILKEIANGERFNSRMNDRTFQNNPDENM